MNVPTLPGPAPTDTAAAADRSGAGRSGAPTQGGDAPAGFTALLVDALASATPTQRQADPQAVTDLAAALEELVPLTEEGNDSDLPGGEVGAEELAAVLLSGSASRPELVAAVRAWRQQAAGADEAVSEGTAVAPAGQAVVEAATAEPPPLATPVTVAMATAGTSPEGASSASVTVETPPSAAAAPAGAPVAATPTLPAAASDRARQAVAEAPARVASEGAEASGPAPAVSVPSSPAATPATTVPTPAASDASLHARLVSRVIEAAEALEHAPPPRTMMVELPDGEGLRLQVSLRGTEVHVQLHGGAGAGTDLGAWGRELAAGLASRGLSLGQFQTGPQGDRGQRRDQPASDDLPAHDDTAPRRPTDHSAADGALRL